MAKKKWMLRLYDRHIRTNYVESVYEAEDRMDVLEIARRDRNFTEHCERRFRYLKGFDDAIATRNFECFEVPDVVTITHQS